MFQKYKISTCVTINLQKNSKTQKKTKIYCKSKKMPKIKE